MGHGTKKCSNAGGEEEELRDAVCAASHPGAGGRRLGRVLLGQPQQRPVPDAERTPHRPLPSGWVSGGRLAQAAA